jgi:hypothetical protein
VHHDDFNLRVALHLTLVSLCQGHDPVGVRPLAEASCPIVENVNHVAVAQRLELPADGAVAAGALSLTDGLDRDSRLG